MSLPLVFYQWKGAMIGIHQQKNSKKNKYENKNDSDKNCRFRGSHIGLPH
jgi:hypothetical protein